MTNEIIICGHIIRPYTGRPLDAGERGACYEVEDPHGAIVGAKTLAQAKRLAQKAGE